MIQLRVMTLAIDLGAQGVAVVVVGRWRVRGGHMVRCSAGGLSELKKEEFTPNSNFTHLLLLSKEALVTLLIPRTYSGILQMERISR